MSIVAVAVCTTIKVVHFVVLCSSETRLFYACVTLKANSFLCCTLLVCAGPGVSILRLLLFYSLHRPVCIVFEAFDLQQEVFQAQVKSLSLDFTSTSLRNVCFLSFCQFHETLFLLQAAPSPNRRMELCSRSVHGVVLLIVCGTPVSLT